MITKRDVINAMMNEEIIKSNETYMNFLVHEIEIMDRKNEARKTSPKVLAKAEEDAKIKNAILELLTNKNDTELTASVIRDKIETEHSLSKVVSIITKLKSDGLVIREKRGKNSYYHLA